MLTNTTSADNRCYSLCARVYLLISAKTMMTCYPFVDVARLPSPVNGETVGRRIASRHRPFPGYVRLETALPSHRASDDDRRQPRRSRRRRWWFRRLSTAADATWGVRPRRRPRRRTFAVRGCRTASGGRLTLVDLLPPRLLLLSGRGAERCAR